MDLLQRSSYSFVLPESLIAAYPLDNRADARLLVVRKKNQTIAHHWIRDLPEILPQESVLVANNTQVIRARLEGTRLHSSGKIEFFALKRLGECVWEGLMRSSAKITAGFEFQVGRGSDLITAKVIARSETTAGTLITARFSVDPIERGIGQVPLPPYIIAKREGKNSEDKVEEDEWITYNTVFAKHSGSVAAPTAGRHFTKALINELRRRGIDWQEITLHVGLGTFKPVNATHLSDHQMHEEWSEITPDVAHAIKNAKMNHRPVITIGTTSTRTLEGRAIIKDGKLELSPGEAAIDLFIHPGSGHEWKWVDGMLTNFHLPESTLFMMVAAFLGDLNFLKKIYQIAIEEKYRFYSYGDAMLILP